MALFPLYVQYIDPPFLITELFGEIVSYDVTQLEILVTQDSTSEEQISVLYNSIGTDIPTELSYAITSGSYPDEISWYILDANQNVVVEGGAPEVGYFCVLESGCYTFIGEDSFGDGWNGANATITNGGIEILDFTPSSPISDSTDFCF